MIKDFFHLQPGSHFLHKTIDLSQLFLLPLEIFLTSFPVKFNKNKHDQQKDHHDQGEPET